MNWDLDFDINSLTHRLGICTEIYIFWPNRTSCKGQYLPIQDQEALRDADCLVFLRQRKDACCPIAFISVPRAYLLLSRVLGSFWMFFFLCAWLSWRKRLVIK
jgi:hypothetical protein